MTLSDALLLAGAPFLLICALFMLAGVLNGPRVGGFRLTLSWGWTLIVLPTIVAGLTGIILTLAT